MSSLDPAQDGTAVARIRMALPEVVAIYRFGSSVDGALRPESDVDLAVLVPRPLDPVARFDLQEQLALALRRPVDVVDLRRISPVMAIQVIARGVLLYDADAEVRGAFEDGIYSAYARLNEERRGVLDRIAAEGTVYGG